MHKFCVCVPICYMYVCICLYVCLFHTLTCSFRSACTPGSFSVSADIFIRKHWPPLLQQRTHSLLRSQRYVNMSAHEKETRSCITETAVFGISALHARTLGSPPGSKKRLVPTDCCVLSLNLQAHLDLSPRAKRYVHAKRLLLRFQRVSTLGSPCAKTHAHAETLLRSRASAHLDLTPCAKKQHAKRLLYAPTPQAHLYNSLRAQTNMSFSCDKTGWCTSS